PPLGKTIDAARAEDAGIETVRQRHHAAAIELEESAGTVDSSRCDEKAPAPVRPFDHPVPPPLRVTPARRRPRGDPLQHQQLGSVQLSDHREPGREPRGGLVDRRQMVDVQEVGAADAGTLEPAGPGAYVTLELDVVER